VSSAPSDPGTARIARTTARPSAGLAVLLACAATGCGADSSPAADGHASGARIVVMAPAAAEMLDALSLLDRVVAVGDFGPWPTAIADLPRAGGYSSPNVERVLSLRADWLVTAASEAAAASHRKLESLGVRVLALDTSTYEGVFESLATVGFTFDRSEQAAQVAADMRRRIEQVAARARDLPRRRVLCVVGRDPLYVAGPGSHLDRLVALAGGLNVVADSASPYQQLSIETVLERLPEVIVDTSDNRSGALRGRQPGAWERWEFLPAVQQDRVYQVDPSRLVIPGLRLPEMTELMARLIHPEVFGEADPASLGPLPLREPPTDGGYATP